MWLNLTSPGYMLLQFALTFGLLARSVVTVIFAAVAIELHESPDCMGATVSQSSPTSPKQRFCAGPSLAGNTKRERADALAVPLPGRCCHKGGRWPGWQRRAGSYSPWMDITNMFSADSSKYARGYVVTRGEDITSVVRLNGAIARATRTRLGGSDG